MFLSPWLYNVLGLAESRKDKRGGVRLVLETLEDRVVPSAVNSGQQLLVTPPPSGGGNAAANAVSTSNAIATPMAAMPAVKVTIDASASNQTFTYRKAPLGNGVPLRVIVTNSSAPNQLVPGSVSFKIYNSQDQQIGNTKTVPANVGTPVQKNGRIIGLTVATLSNGLPVMNPGTYTVKVTYQSGNTGFTVGAVTNGTITVASQQVTVTVLPNPKTVFFSENQTTVKIVASLNVAKQPLGYVNEGRVDFTVTGNGFTKTDSGILVQQNGPLAGTASDVLTLPASQKVGTYNIEATYFDANGPNNFVAAKPGKATFTIAPAKAGAMANPGGATFSTNPQTVTVSATVPDLSDPSVPVNEGTVTFVVAGIGAVQGAVSNGTASANIVIPAGEKVGNYAITVSYSDSSGDFIDGGDANSTLTIGQPPPPPGGGSGGSFTTIQVPIATIGGTIISFPLVLPSATLMNQMVSEVEGIALDSEALLFQNDPLALGYLNSLSEQLLGQPLPSQSDLVPTIVQLIF